jgi:hypothetical protein
MNLGERAQKLNKRRLFRLSFQFFFNLFDNQPKESSLPLDFSLKNNTFMIGERL